MSEAKRKKCKSTFQIIMFFTRMYVQKYKKNLTGVFPHHIENRLNYISDSEIHTNLYIGNMKIASIGPHCHCGNISL